MENQMKEITEQSNQFATTITNQVAEVKTEMKQEMGSLSAMMAANQGTMAMMANFLQNPQGFFGGGPPGVTPPEPAPQLPQLAQQSQPATEHVPVAPKEEVGKEKKELADEIETAVNMAVSSGGEEQLPPPAKAARKDGTDEL